MGLARGRPPPPLLRTLMVEEWIGNGKQWVSNVSTIVEDWLCTGLGMVES